MQGNWTITLTGRTGCGLVSMLVKTQLGNDGKGGAEIFTHGECNNYSYSGNQTFTILNLYPDGSGEASLSCGAGCGWNFDIQVSPDGSIFNIVDIKNPNNFIGGVAVRRGPEWIN